ncbi:hypothetical protein [Paludisphaera soli]|uniref:hypothetical protein n=1 Tax=Paludisphaera soli TaxID=2712865 RepID=UPI001F0ED0EF|nr:hypothetical protein [Paludisphaera soli]
MSSGTSGAQDWRAIACLAPNGERLLCVGESSSQVRAAYAGAWGEVIRDEDRPTVRAISLQRWTGQFWSGQWEHQTYLAVPATRTGKAPGGDADGDIDGEVEAELDGGVAVAVEEDEDELLEAGDGQAEQN